MDESLFGRWMVVRENGLVRLQDFITEWFKGLPFTGGAGSIKVSLNGDGPKSLTSKEGDLSLLLVEHLQGVLPDSVGKEEHAKIAIQSFEAPDYKGTSKNVTMHLVATPSPEALRQIAAAQTGPGMVPSPGLGDLPTINPAVGINLNVNELITVITAPLVEVIRIQRESWGEDVKRLNDIKSFVMELGEYATRTLPQIQIKQFEMQLDRAKHQAELDARQEAENRRMLVDGGVQIAGIIGNLGERIIEKRPELADRVTVGIEGLGKAAVKLSQAE